MKFIFIVFLFTFCYNASNSQIIRSEIIDLAKESNNLKYSTYHFVKADYSFSRLPIIFITDKKVFDNIYISISSIFLKKQEYTDVYILGIENFKEKSSNDTTNNLIKMFIKDISHYRVFNNLPNNDENLLLKELIYLSNKNNLCKYLICR